MCGESHDGCLHECTPGAGATAEVLGTFSSCTKALAAGQLAEAGGFRGGGGSAAGLVMICPAGVSLRSRGTCKYMFVESSQLDAHEPALLVPELRLSACAAVGL